MEKEIPTEEAKKIEAELKKQEVDFEIGYDCEGSLHILCGEEDEEKILGIIDDLKLPYSNFMWFGSFASDNIVEELSA